jgi:hypothetical protein
MKPSCPRCHTPFGLFSSPKLESWWRDPISHRYCPYCRAPLTIATGRRAILKTWLLPTMLTVVVYGSKWILWRLFAPKTALMLWAAASLLSIGIFVVYVLRTIEYVERS